MLNHLGGLWRIGPYADARRRGAAAWRKGIAEVAACPNVYLKLGGIGMPRIGFDWHTRDKPIGSEELARDDGAGHRPTASSSSARTGACSRATSRWTRSSFSHHVLFNAFKRLLEGYSPTERAACSTTRPRASTWVDESEAEVAHPRHEGHTADCQHDQPNAGAGQGRLHADQVGDDTDDEGAEAPRG